MTYKKQIIGDLVNLVKVRNKDLAVNKLMGLSRSKIFIPSVANIIGTDLSKYFIVNPNQFAYMKDAVDEGAISIAMNDDDVSYITSPSYATFEIKDQLEILPEYMLLWVSRSGFDHSAWFYADDSIRGTLNWEKFCQLEILVPPLEKQKSLVRSFKALQDKLKINNQLIEKIDSTFKAIYKKWFVDFELENSMTGSSTKPQLVYNDIIEKEIPCNWKIEPLSSLTTLITLGNTPRLIFDKAFPNSVPFLRVDSISTLNHLNWNKTSFIDKDYHDNQLKRSQLLPNDLIISVKASVGRFAIVPLNTNELNLNLAISFIRFPQNNQSLVPFIYWLLLSGWSDDYIKANTTGAVIPYFSLYHLAKMPIPIIPEKEFNYLMNRIKPMIDYRDKLAYEINTLEKVKQIFIESLVSRFTYDFSTQNKHSPDNKLKV